MAPRNCGDIAGNASKSTFGGSNRFCDQKVCPNDPWVLPKIEKWTKKKTKEPPDGEKELQKSSLFGAKPGGLREALTINRRIDRIFGYSLLFVG